jgi:hypothetical protein
VGVGRLKKCVSDLLSKRFYEIAVKKIRDRLVGIIEKTTVWGSSRNVLRINTRKLR